ncbi:DUF6602 domain-containing protein [Streptomyces sp. NPDC101062]|uniref:DUF6602 domain-containing protein n=1 Tax=unclassified Streptomyces TaxID=2593676 RepID=UPI003820F7C1
MTGGDDVCAQQQKALAEFRQMANTVIQLNRAFHDSADLHHGDDIGFEREAALLCALGYRFDGITLLQRLGIEDPTTGRWFEQHDIAFADDRVTPHRTLSSGRVRLDPRGVHAVIEVKSHLDTRKLEESLSHIATVQAASRRRVGERHLKFPTSIGFVPYVPVSGGVFGYRSRLTLATLAEKVTEWVSGRPPENWPHFITVLDRGHLMWCDPNTGEAVHRPLPGSVLMRLEREDDTDPLVSLVAHLHELARIWHVPGTELHMKPNPLPNGIGIGVAVRPVGVPAPPPCMHYCANCHATGRMTYDEQRQVREAEQHNVEPRRIIT